MFSLATEDAELSVSAADRTVTARVFPPTVNREGVAFLPGAVDPAPFLARPDVMFGAPGRDAVVARCVSLRTATDGSLVAVMRFGGDAVSEQLFRMYQSGILWSFLLRVRVSGSSPPLPEESGFFPASRKVRAVVRAGDLVTVSVDPYAPV